MKKLMILILLVSSASVFGQSAQFGIKGGLNFGSTGEFSDLTQDLNTTIDGDNKVGFHLGVYSQFKFLGIFVQPEILYTRLNTEYGEGGTTADYNFSKLDIPLLLGIDLIGPLSLKAGPSFQLALNNELDLEGFNTNDPENSFTIGYQIGAGLQLGRLGVDLRYEGAFSENDTSITGDISGAATEFFTIDSRPSQWILSLSYQLKAADKK